MHVYLGVPHYRVICSNRLWVSHALLAFFLLGYIRTRRACTALPHLQLFALFRRAYIFFCQGFSFASFCYFLVLCNAIYLLALHNIFCFLALRELFLCLSCATLFYLASYYFYYHLNGRRVINATSFDRTPSSLFCLAVIHFYLSLTLSISSFPCTA